MKDIAIVGGGRLGTCLARALAARGYTIGSVACRTLGSARESVRLVGQGRPTANGPAAAATGRIVFLCLPDDALDAAARRLAAGTGGWKSRFVFHTSGLRPAAVLAPLAARGARTGSFHPVQSFPAKDSDLRLFRGIAFGIEGGGEARSLGARLARRLGGVALHLAAEDKPLYHAACSLTSNGGAAVLGAALDLLSGLGLDKEAAGKILLPLAEGTLRNVKEIGASAALTGPVGRGDAATVRTHLEALKDRPVVLELYRMLATLALRTARARGLDDRRVRAVKRALAA